MRLIEPASKRRTVELLSHYFGITNSQRIYRNIPDLVKQKYLVELYAFRVAVEKFKGPYYFVLYDVTSLYFKIFQSNELRISDFSKDNKSQQPQIFVGLLITQFGFPLVFEVFPGNTFEGKAMLPILENFMNEHIDIRPIVLIDTALMSEERLTELNAKISPILSELGSKCQSGFDEKIGFDQFY